MSGEGNLTQQTFDEAKAAAREAGFDVIEGDDYSLLLDIDTPEARQQFDRVMPKLREHFPVQNVFAWCSKSNHWHVLVQLSEPLPVWHRITLQAALGSDGVKEMLSVKRWLNGVTQPSMLFRPSGAKVTQTP